MAPLIPARQQLEGLIASADFRSGDCFVVGIWSSGPLGPMNDVMWIRPDRARTLIAPDESVATFVSAVYEFDEVLIAPVSVRRSRRLLSIEAGPVQLELPHGPSIPLPLPSVRPLWFTKWIESPIAHRLMGVSTHGVTSKGLDEWYQARSLAFVRDAAALVEGASCGPQRVLDRALDVGFSNPPARPSVVRVRPVLFDPFGGLDRVLAEIQSGE